MCIFSALPVNKKKDRFEVEEKDVESRAVVPPLWGFGAVESDAKSDLLFTEALWTWLS